jgi:ribosomal protein S18 acetylase RimI-like enzyme
MSISQDTSVRIAVATVDDIPAWVELAREAEPLFGPMVDDPGFHAALRRCVDRGSAFCVRESDGPPGSPLVAGLLFSPKPPVYKLGWLVVTSSCRRQGVGRALAQYAIGLIRPPAELTVVTFGEDNEAGQPARHFYESLGFCPGEAAPRGPEGGTRQVYRIQFT